MDIRTPRGRQALIAILAAGLASLLSTATVLAGGGTIPWPSFLGG